MKLLLFAELAIIAILIYLIITQIVLPLVADTPIFPMFNKLSKKVDKTAVQVSDLREQVENMEELKELSKEKSRLERELEEASVETASTKKNVDTPST